MAKRFMGPVDAIWLNMDLPQNLMVIDGIWALEGPADWDRMKSLIQHRLVDKFPPFRQVVVPPRFKVGPPTWEDPANFDIENHLVRATLPSADDAALQRYVEEHMSMPMSRDRPLWESHFIDGHHRGSVLYTRVHHCIADGIALSQTIISMTSDTPDGDLVAEPEAPAKQLVEFRPRPRAPRTVRERMAAVKERVPKLSIRRAARSGARKVTESIRQVSMLGTLLNKFILSGRPTGPLTGAPGVAKRAVWADPFPLADIKRLGHRTGTTVNDVLMGAMAGALGSYVEQNHGSRRMLPTMVPVNVRPMDALPPPELGNDFALVVLEYPSDIEAPLQRIIETHRRMEAIKHSPEVPIVFSAIWAIGHTVKDMERVMVDFFSNKAVGVTTNVPGPRATRYAAGSKVLGMLAWVPTTGDQTLGISIYSYDGNVWVGFKADAERVPEPESLVRAFNDEIAELRRLAETV